jgi:alanine racemase
VSYGRTFIAKNPMTIATIDLGYADGFRRCLSNGIGELKVKGEWRQVLGRICMDMCMIDVTGLEVQEGDEVVIFDDASSIKKLANAQNTIPYEVLTSIGQRVKRMYLAGV